MRRAVLGGSGSGGAGEEEHRSHSNYVRKSRPVRAGRRERFSSPTCATQPELPQNLHQGVPTGVITGQEGKARKGELGSRREDSLHVVLTHSVTHIITVPVWRAVLARDLLAARRRAAPKPRGRPRWRSNELGDSRPRRHCRAGPCAVRPAAERIGCEAPIEERRDKTIKTAHHARGYALTAHGLEIVELLWRARVPG